MPNRSAVRWTLYCRLRWLNMNQRYSRWRIFATWVEISFTLVVLDLSSKWSMRIKNKYNTWIFERWSHENKSKENIVLSTLLLLLLLSLSRHLLSLPNLYLFDLFKGLINHINNMYLSCNFVAVHECVISFAAFISAPIFLKACSIIFLSYC
jgi:hypothetical protein